MIDDTTIFIVGPSLGLMVFFLNTSSMEGIFSRPTSDGGKEFTLDIIKDYIAAPFKVGTPEFNTLWANYKELSWKDKVKMLQLNWIAMVGSGLAASALTVWIKRYLF